jgi:hypothetical protein
MNLVCATESNRARLQPCSTAWWHREPLRYHLTQQTDSQQVSTIQRQFNDYDVAAAV